MHWDFPTGERILRQRPPLRGAETFNVELNVFKIDRVLARRHRLRFSATATSVLRLRPAHRGPAPDFAQDDRAKKTTCENPKFRKLNGKRVRATSASTRGRGGRCS